MKQKFKLSIQKNFCSNYFFVCFIYAKNINSVKRTKIYKSYLKQLNESKITGLQYEIY